MRSRELVSWANEACALPTALDALLPESTKYLPVSEIVIESPERPTIPAARDRLAFIGEIPN